MITHTPIYMNACSHGLPDASCAEAVGREALRPAGRPDEEAAVRDRARRTCAALLGTDPARVGLGVGTFQLWGAAMERVSVRPGRILVAGHEWGDHVRWLQRRMVRNATTIEVVPAEGGEAFDPAAWAARMGEDVLALCLPLVTSVEGLRYPAKEIAALARPEGALVVIDAAQALGRVPIDPEDLGCDILVSTARKWLRGPRQTAVFWLSERAERTLECEVRSIEPVDINGALLAGLSQAVDLTQTRGIPAISEDVATLEQQLRVGLEEAPAVAVRRAETAGTISCAVHPDKKPALDAKLRENGIVAKWCNAARDEPLSGAEPGAASLRISPHVYNTDEDIAAVLGAVRAA